MHRRLSDQDIAQNITDAALIRLVTELIKLADRRSADPVTRHRTTNVLAIVQGEGLPLDRQLGLIQKAMDQAREDGESTEPFEQALKQLSPPKEDPDAQTP